MTEDEIEDASTWAGFLEIYAKSGVSANLHPDTCAEIAKLLRKIVKEEAETGLEGRGA